MTVFSVRMDDLELRNGGTHSPAEIVRWDGASCYTLLFFEPAKESPNVRSVGARPWASEVDPVVLNRLIRIGFSLLDGDE